MKNHGLCEPPEEAESTWTFHIDLATLPPEYFPAGEWERDVREVLPPIAHYSWESDAPRPSRAICGAPILGIDAFEPYVLCEECVRTWGETFEAE